jgi:site-specific recombinase XerD
MYELYCAKKEKNIKAHLENPKLTKQMRKELGNFIEEYSTARKLSVPAKESYVRSLSLFGEFLADKEYSSYKQAKKEDLKEYLKAPYPRLDKKGNKKPEKSDSVLVWLRSSLKILYRWLLLGKVNRPKREDRYPELVDWIEVGIAKGRKITDKDIISPDEFKRMLDVTTGMRDRAILSLLYETGMRLGELMSLKLEDVHFDNDRTYLHITRSKTEPRTIYIFDSVADLKGWMSTHPYKNDPGAYLFERLIQLPRKKGEKEIKLKKSERPISYQSVLEKIKRIAKKAGINRRVWCHLLRHSAATADSRRDMPLDLMQMKYGWSHDSRMPYRYMHKNPDDLRRWEEAKRGVGDEKPHDAQEPKKCYRCGRINSWEKTLCESCGMHLDKQVFEQTRVFEKLASQTVEEQNRKIEEQDKKIDELKEMVSKMQAQRVNVHP